MKYNYKVVSIYDTETTNIGEGVEARAFPCLFIFNDIRNVELKNYRPDVSDDIRLYRTLDEVSAYIFDLITFGMMKHYVPIVCAYNLMFDLQPLMYMLRKQYDMSVLAQTGSSVYTLDLMLNEKPVLRFWDCFYFEMNGLAAMGETCGLPKAKGFWDYNLIRTSETQLTPDEKFYAGRDTQVIPAYLKWLLDSNDWLKSEDFGTKVMTKTSLVRQMAKHEIGGLKFKLRSGKQESLARAFSLTAFQEFSKTYESYALRKACFRGGLTFTSAAFASLPVSNVASLDVTSMHHAFINGRRLPSRFAVMPASTLQMNCDRIMNMSVETVLNKYDNPFKYAVHARIRFNNVRLKNDSCFAKWGIGIIPRSKFSKHVAEMDYGKNERAKVAEETIRNNGWRDYAENPVFAFGKLMEADNMTLYVSEIELWNICQVYDFDGMIVEYGEGSCKSIVPPDYITLQSNLLFGRKTDVKKILHGYHEEPYSDVSDTIPVGLRNEIINGSLKKDFLQAYYDSTVKGQFNGIYGTQSQDLLKPDYVVDADAELSIDNDTVCTEDNYDKMKPRKPSVLYTYGMRIVGGSRMHLIIAMILLYDYFGDRIGVTGGDTDSLKIRCDENVTDDELLKALEPLHEAVRMAINKTQYRVRNTTQLASTLKNIGEFDIEDCGGSHRWQWHMELWNKARVSMSDNKIHVTCAGLPQPSNERNIVDFLEDYLQRGYKFEDIIDTCMGYNVFVAHNVSHTLQKHQPKMTDRYVGKVTDYKGVERDVDMPESIALYNSGRWLGETDKPVNMENIKYLKEKYGRIVDMESRELRFENNHSVVRSVEDGRKIL